MKKITLLSLVILICFFFTACKKDDKPSKSEVENLLKLPYSQLDPEQQKTKLEQESIDFLEEFRGLQNLAAFDALEHFVDLLDRDEPNVPEPLKEVSEIKDVFNLDGVTGVFTWNSSQNRWVETSSKTELKFVFPATSSATTNNATLVVRTQNSGITFTETWWDYDCEYDEDWNWVCEEIEKERLYHLPKSATATLTIGGKEEAKIEFGAEYKNGKEVPEVTTYKMTIGGYVLQTTVDKSGEEKASMKISRNNKILLNGVVKTNAKLHELEDLLIKGDDYEDEDIYKRLGNADAYIKLMENLAIAYKVETEKYAREMDVIREWYDNNYPTSSTSTYYTKYGQLHKEKIEKDARLFNDYMTAALVSIKDNFKIADLVAVAEKTGECWRNIKWNSEDGYWEWSDQRVKLYDEYNIVIYLKFNDNTLVEAEAYFGDGFDNVIDKFNELRDEFGF
jgi:hypothetical protein